MDVQPEQVQRQERVAAVDVPLPQREQERMPQERELELQRQRQQAEANVPETLETPQITTQQSQQPELEARRNNKTQANPQNSQRRMETVERRINETVSEATVRFRAEPNALQQKLRSPMPPQRPSTWWQRQTLGR